MEKLKNIPSLRFSEFNEKWKSNKLGEIGKLLGGGTPSTKNIAFWNGIIPWVSSSDLKDESIYQINATRFITDDAVTQSATKLIPKKSILIVSRVGVGKVAINEVELCTSQDFTNLILHSDNYIFLAYFLKIKTNKLLEFNQGTSIKGFVKSDLEGLELNIPTLPEQNKIATFLTAVDEKLQALKQKKNLLEQYKKGVMQQLFSQELRFKDDNGNDFADWEEKKLGEIAERKTIKNKEGITNVLTISAQLGLISQLEFFNKSVSAKDVSGYYLLEKGDFAYNKSYSKGYPMGAIKCLNRYDKGVVSTLYICFSFIENISLPFMEQYFETGLQNKEIELVAQEGARNHGLLNIGLKDFFGIQLYIPCLEEQTKIANFLSAIDEKINQCQAQITNTEVWKKGLLQKMFV